MEKSLDYSAKVFGSVRLVSQEPKNGIWIVDDLEVRVTPETKFIEEYGRAETGAYVEVTGNYVGKTFVAGEIEVRMERK